MTDPFDTCLQLGQSQRVEVSLSDQRGGVLAPAGDTLSRLVAVHEVCLDAAPAERPTVAQMAARLGLTPRQLLYQFSKAAGSLWRYGRASGAEQLGYANPYHFSRVFKAVTDLSPSAIRAGGAGLHTHTKPPGNKENKP